MTPGSGALVSSLVINTDEQGEAVARITANVGAITQVATIQTTDVTSGLARRYNFTIVQQVSGVGILSTLPSGSVTITGANGATTGAPGSCPIGVVVDYYIYGGTPPYSVASPQSGVATVSPNTVGISGGRFAATITGCGGPVAFIVTDASGRAVETSTLEAVRGATGAGGPTAAATVLLVSPDTITLNCGESRQISTAGSGSYSTNVSDSSSSPGGSEISVTQASTAIGQPFTISRTRVPTAQKTVFVNVVAGAIIKTVTVTSLCP